MSALEPTPVANLGIWALSPVATLGNSSSVSAAWVLLSTVGSLLIDGDREWKAACRNFCRLRRWLVYLWIKHHVSILCEIADRQIVAPAVIWDLTKFPAQFGQREVAQAEVQAVSKGRNKRGGGTFMFASFEVHTAARDSNDPPGLIKNWAAAGAAFDWNRRLIRCYLVFVVLRRVFDTNELSFKTASENCHWFALVGEVQKFISWVRKSDKLRRCLRDFQRQFWTNVRQRVVGKFRQEVVGLTQRYIRLIGDRDFRDSSDMDFFSSVMEYP